MAEKWGSWIIVGMPDRVLETAIKDISGQLAKIEERLKTPHSRSAEFEKTRSVLMDLGDSLEAEKARRHG